ncbi:hypothetical protein G7046_g8632 [Stylonectria norvegica]|nr:hypothetical protein G7046_g8632 [Stylonectria norvegica]
MREPGEMLGEEEGGVVIEVSAPGEWVLRSGALRRAGSCGRALRNEMRSSGTVKHANTTESPRTREDAAEATQPAADDGAQTAIQCRTSSLNGCLGRRSTSVRRTGSLAGYERAGVETSQQSLGVVTMFVDVINFMIMASQPDQPVIEAVNAVVPGLLISTENSNREQPADNTCRPDFDPVTRKGEEFIPFNIQQRDPVICRLPNSPLLLFQHFVPIFLVKRWVSYTNEHVAMLLQQPLGPEARLRSWVPVSVGEVYIWLAILIYVGIHTEIRIIDHWKTAQINTQLPAHPIIKYMTYNRFHQLFRHIRIFDPSNSNEPATYGRVAEWSDYIQQASTALFIAGTNLAVDEAMARFTGRLNETTKVPSKPIPLGFKIWVVAQQGFFLRWIWHKPGPAFDRAAATAFDSTPAPQATVATANTAAVAFDDDKAPGPLNPTQSHGATGIARINCGFYKPYVKLKVADKGGKSGFAFNEVRTAPTINNEVNQIAWKDNALVLMLSTVFKGDEFEVKKRKKPNTEEPRARPIKAFFGDDPQKEFPVPSIGARYNDEMNAVD